jgi:hypothetical protein
VMAKLAEPQRVSVIIPVEAHNIRDNNRQSRFGKATNHFDAPVLHWLRDTVYREDHSTTRTRSAPRVMAALRTSPSERSTCSAAATSPKPPAGQPAPWTARSQSSNSTCDLETTVGQAAPDGPCAGNPSSTPWPSPSVTAGRSLKPPEQQRWKQRCCYRPPWNLGHAVAVKPSFVSAATRRRPEMAWAEGEARS